MDTQPHILIVEDSPTQARQLETLLSSFPVQTSLATDGLEALRLVDSTPPDLILLDITLPTLDGYQVCSRLKRDRNTSHIPVLILTSIDSADGILQGIEAGADDFIAKDAFMAENLLATVETYLTILTDRE
ncbi:MAG TPA: response regulator [Aggregatilineales bacterium]|nr:response regulator [Aggregatilineales bacterium]